MSFVIPWLDTLCQQIIAWYPMRRMLESCLRRRAWVTTSHFSRETLIRRQTRLLLGLVHQARHTRFGKEQNFARARTVADFRRLTPLTDPAKLTNQYWEPVFPWLDQTTWHSFSRIVDPPRGDCAYLPVTPAFVAGAAEVWLAGLGQVMRATPHQYLLRGRVLGLLDPAAEPLVDAAWSQFPWTLRPYLSLRHPNQLGGTDFHTPTTCLLASRVHLTGLVQRLRQQTGCCRLKEVWPDLFGVVLLRKPEDAPLSTELTGALDGTARLVEVVVDPQGIFAISEATPGPLRLLPDCGIYHELIDAEQRQGDNPPRLGLHEATAGRLYEMVSTTAGLWACRTGVGVVFTNPASLAVRFVSLPPLLAPKPVEEPKPIEVSHTSTKPPRSRLLPGLVEPSPTSLLRLPWSTPADR